MPANYVLLNTITLTATTSSVTFSNIPQSGYTDLKIVYSARSNDNVNGWNLTRLQFNTDTTASNYNYRVLGGFGSTAYSGYGTQAVGYTTAGGRTANTFGNGEIYIPNYLGSTQKSYSGDSVTEGNGSTYEILGFHAVLWSGTAAINQIILSLDNSASFVANSTFSLYGIAAVGTTPVIAPKATGGDLVYNDGTNWIHIFNSTGVFTPQTGLSCDYLVVAGGGGGGQGGGGGGAGGYRTSIGGSPLSVSAQNYTITVGAGGVNSSSTTNPPVPTNTNGVNSTFSSITATGGGRGGSYDITPGANGGSGGGGSDGGFGTASPSGQGNNGGTGTFVSGGGGGGAGAVGGNGAGVAGNGGNGLSNSISGSSVTYAGGGGGGTWAQQGAAGTGGSGGGGAGTNQNTTASSGTRNLGGGGGGGSFGQWGVPAFPPSGNGGSGIVIIRYPMA